jgi:hypothetical protein
MGISLKNHKAIKVAIPSAMAIGIRKMARMMKLMIRIYNIRLRGFCFAWTEGGIQY